MGVALEIEIGGCANNAPVELVGTGQRDGDQLRLDVEAVRSTLHWDPVLGVLGMLDALLLAAVRDDVPVSTWARTVMHDDQGREMGALVLSGALDGDGDRLRYRGQFLECRVRFEVGEHLVRVEPFQVMTIQSEHRLIATSAWTLSTGRGNTYRAVTTSAWEGERLATERPIVRCLDLARGNEGHVSIDCRTPAKGA